MMSKVWYGHHQQADFCAPNTLYTMIHTNIINGGTQISGEIISLHQIASKIGYSRGRGSILSPGHLSSLSISLRRKAKSVDRSLKYLEVEEYKWNDFGFLRGRLESGESVCVCLPFKIYRDFFIENGKVPPCLSTTDLEPPGMSLLSHCVLLFPISSDEIAILDPHCECKSQSNPESTSSFIKRNRDKLEIMSADTFISDILMVRRDTLDDSNKQVIYTAIKRTQEKKQLRPIESYEDGGMKTQSGIEIDFAVLNGDDSNAQ